MAVATRSPPIRCAGLTKRFGARAAVADFDLDVLAGTITGFLGANGAGKTTVIRMLVGLLRPTGGQALLWGQPAAAAPARRRVGYMPADPVFYPALSGRENLDLFAGLRGVAATRRDWAIELLDLDQADLARPVGSYSSGMRQKLGLVQAVQHAPELVILDEPANRLDPLAHRRFEMLVRELAGGGGTVFLSSHTLSEVEDVCDRVAMLRAGRLVAVRDVAELAALARRRIHAVYRSPPRRLPAALVEPRFEDGSLTGSLPRGALDAVRELLADPNLVDLTIERGSLEEMFLALYAEAGGST